MSQMGGARITLVFAKQVETLGGGGAWSAISGRPLTIFRAPFLMAISSRSHCRWEACRARRDTKIVNARRAPEKAFHRQHPGPAILPSIIQISQVQVARVLISFSSPKRPDMDQWSKRDSRERALHVAASVSLGTDLPSYEFSEGRKCGWFEAEENS